MNLLKAEVKHKAARPATNVKSLLPQILHKTKNSKLKLSLKKPCFFFHNLVCRITEILYIIINMNDNMVRKCQRQTNNLFHS